MSAGRQGEIEELEARVQALSSKNILLSETCEDYLLLAAISELVNTHHGNLADLLGGVMERICLLQGIPFCAYCVKAGDRLLFREYYFSLSDVSLSARQINLPSDFSTKHTVHCCAGEKLKSSCKPFMFGDFEFTPGAVMLIACHSSLNPAYLFFAADSSTPESYLRKKASLLERITEIICTRIDNMLLADSLGELNKKLDQKVIKRTRQLARVNEELRREILDRRQAQRELNEERELLMVTLASIGDGVISTDIEGRVVLMNKVAEELTGWSMKEAGSRPLTEIFRIINEQSRKLCANPVDRVMKFGEVRGVDNNTVLLARDGREILIGDSGAAIRDASGRIIGVVLVFRDITESRRLESEMFKVRKLESVGVLAGGIAHDFNNLLAGIMGNISLAMLRSKKDDDICALLAEAEKASHRARDLTQQLLTFSRGGEPVKKLSSIGDIIRDSSAFVLRGSKVGVEYAIAPDLLPLEIDPGQISQVIRNLIINAVHAMPAGGLIRIKAENYYITSAAAETLPPGAYVCLRVADNGIGIKPELLERIFDPYFSTKRIGSGLGLAITHSIIRKHHGEIRVKSWLGKGTEFIILLPALERVKLQASEKGDAAPELYRGKGRILIMDDEEMLRTMLFVMLSRCGYEVLQAVDGEEVVRIYREAAAEGKPIDLVVMDLTIPGGMGGREAVRELRLFDPRVKALVASGYSNDPVMADYGSYGFSGAIAKPFKFQELCEQVRKILG
ncbi:hybrid sensor histidine kinase/response regulator [Desulfobacterota bacterium M19]